MKKNSNYNSPARNSNYNSPARNSNYYDSLIKSDFPDNNYTSKKNNSIIEDSFGDDSLKKKEKTHKAGLNIIFLNLF